MLMLQRPKGKFLVQVGIDSIAGPSEVLIVADKTANPDYVAIDLLSQAEHDEQAQAILLTNDLELAQNVQNSIEKFLKELPRSKIASSSWNDFGSIILLRKYGCSNRPSKLKLHPSICS